MRGTNVAWVQRVLLLALLAPLPLLSGSPWEKGVQGNGYRNQLFYLKEKASTAQVSLCGVMQQNFLICLFRKENKPISGTPHLQTI